MPILQNRNTSTMKKITVLLLLTLSSFGLGLSVNYKRTNQENHPELRKVTGIGGIFFKCTDPKKIRAWYSQHLGLSVNPYGSVFEWRQALDSTRKGFTQWSPFRGSTKYFEPSRKDFMINYRVANLDMLVAELRKEGVTICDTIESFSYGKFVHIMDPDSNKIELWEPNDTDYENLGIQAGYPTTK
ncbi:MAG: VOC family protein [Saprospiraceae bacterium]